MIHHVAIDVPAGAMSDATAFWSLLGFAEVPARAGGGWRWLERGGTQLHLRPVDGEGGVSPGGAAGGAWHVAVVVDDYEATVARLAEAGAPVTPGAAHWGAPRGKTTAPGGVVVEVMAAAPGVVPPTGG